MLSITFQSGNERKWYIGMKNPVNFDEVRAIAEIQADGDELDHITRLFTINPLSHPLDQIITIPIPKNKKVVRWYGDIAHVIIGNL